MYLVPCSAYFTVAVNDWEIPTKHVFWGGVNIFSLLSVQKSQFLSCVGDLQQPRAAVVNLWSVFADTVREQVTVLEQRDVSKPAATSAFGYVAS